MNRSAINIIRCITLVSALLMVDNATAEPLLTIPDSFDFGKVPAGVRLAADIPVTNKSKSPARMLFKASDCGCASATTGTLVGAGASGELGVTIDTSRSKKGVSSKSLVFAVNGDSDLRKAIVTFEVGDLLVNPQKFDLGPCVPGSKKTIAFTINKIAGWKDITCKVAASPLDRSPVKFNQYGRR